MSGTQNFARLLPDARQLLVYSMSIQLESELAMILPLPVVPGSSVEFINLEGEEKFFDRLRVSFPPLDPVPAARSFGGGSRGARGVLPVFDVGRYVASFVPGVADFDRLDARFRLPDQLLSTLPIYDDYGFAVFQLKPGPNTQALQPMALSFTPREARALFFPTVHVHDGSVPDEANFDHTLFCQTDGVLEATLGWIRSNTQLGTHMQGAVSRKLIDVACFGFAQGLWGTLPNRDRWLREPSGVTLAELSGQGPEYRYRISATAAHAFGWENTERALWIATAATRLSALCRGVREGLPELVAKHGQAWQLTPLTPVLPPHFMNGRQLWTGTNYMNGKPTTGGGPGVIHFTPFSRHVEPQAVTLAFSRVPDQDTALAINDTLRELLERAVA